MLLSLLLYGSRARGDHRLRSDVDLLGIVESGVIGREIAARGSSFYHYPLPALASAASSGDLFVSHLVHEAKVLHDTAGIFKRVQASFQWRDNYRSDRRKAKMIIRYITLRPESLEGVAVRKRLIWAVRTMIIASAAEEHKPIFGARDLANYVSMPQLKQVIDGRTTVDVDDLISVALEVSAKCGAGVRYIWPVEFANQNSVLIKAGGILASTVRLVADDGPVKNALSDGPTIDYPM